MKKVIPVILLLLMVSVAIHADCPYGDKNYPEGAIRGPYICINGDWVRM